MCVLLRKENPLFVRDLAPHQCLLSRKASAAIAWGSSMHWVQVWRALWKGNKSGNHCFLLLSSNIRERGQVVWIFSKVFCWNPGNQESKPQLGWDPHHWHAGSISGRRWSEQGIGDFFWGKRGFLASRVCVAAWAGQDVRDVTQRMYEGSRLHLWSVKIVVWLRNQWDVV